MYKGLNIITNEGLWFKLTNSTSFGESVFSVGFIQKTIKVDLDVRPNRANPQRKQPQKVLEDSRGHHTEAKSETPPGGAIGQPAPVPISQPPASYVDSPLP